RQGSIANHDGHNWVGAGQNAVAELAEVLAEKPSVGLEPVTQLGGSAEQLEDLEGGAGDAGGQCVREQVGSRQLPQQLDDLFAAAGVAAAGAAQCLAQSAGENIHTAHNLVELGSAAAMRPHEPYGVRIVHHHHRLVFLSQVADGRQVRDKPVHGENAVG